MYGMYVCTHKVYKHLPSSLTHLPIHPSSIIHQSIPVVQVLAHCTTEGGANHHPPRRKTKKNNSGIAVRMYDAEFGKEKGKILRYGMEKHMQAKRYRNDIGRGGVVRCYMGCKSLLK